MSTQPRCTCGRCTIRGFMGPAIITTLGILFLLSELEPRLLLFRSYVSDPVHRHRSDSSGIRDGSARRSHQRAGLCCSADRACATHFVPPPYTSPTPGQGQ